MHRFLICILLLSAMLGIVSITSIHASERRVLTVEETNSLITRSPIIVRGKVAALSTHAVPAPKGLPHDMTLIFTDAVIACAEVFRGAGATSKITITYLGGCLEDRDLCMEVTGIPRLQVGDDRVFFLRQQQDGRIVPTARTFSIQPVVNDRLAISNLKLQQLRSQDGLVPPKQVPTP